MKWISTRSARHNIGIVVTVAILLEAISAAQYYYAHRLLEDELETRVLAELRFKAFALQQTLESAEQSLQEHLWYINEYIDYPDSMTVAAERLILVNKKVVGGCLAFVPDYYPQKGRLFEPYAYEEGNVIKVEQIADRDGHDYTRNPVFNSVVKENRPSWSDPYKYDTPAGRLSLTTYSYPIADPQGTVVAVCGIDVSLSWLGDTLNARHLHSSSFDLFLTGAGELIAGPSEQNVSRTRVDLVKTIINDSTIERETTSNERVKVITFYDDEQGDEGYIYYASMREDPQWQVVLVCYEDEVFGKLKTMRLYVALLMLAAFLLLLYIIRRTVNNSFRLQRVNMEKERISSELHIAQGIQRQMLPKRFPPFPDRDDIDVYGSLVPAREVGGDLFDFFLRDDKLFFCIGDVSGKGVPSAMVMAQAHSLFHMASTRETNPGRIMQVINERVCEGNDSNMFITLFIGVLDLPTGRLRYCNAGHPAPLINGVPLEANDNLAVGVFPGVKFKMRERRIQYGDTIFLFTDGLNEAMNQAQQLFGKERMMDICLQHAAAAKENPQAASPQVLIKTMYEAVNSYVGDVVQSDDLTLLAIRYTRQQHDARLHCDITLECNIDEVPKLADFVDSVCFALNLSPSLTMQMNLAIEEAVVNVINYAYPVGSPGKVNVEATANDQVLKFIVIDSGKPFDPTTRGEVDTLLPVEERNIGGLGIHLIRKYMDSINYEREDGKNILTLRKQLNNTSNS